MEKPANNQYPIHELLRKRWSPRAFSQDAISSETILRLFEAARWSPSGGNMQPWRFVVARNTDPEAHARLVESLVEKNRQWATSAPLLVLAVAKRERDPGKPNPWHAYDLGQSVAHLTFQATSMGLSVHQMGGIDPVKARELLGIPDGYDPITAIAIGHQGTLDDLPEGFRDREQEPRTRLSLGEVVFDGTWASPIEVSTTVLTESAH